MSDIIQKTHAHLIFYFADVGRLLVPRETTIQNYGKEKEGLKEEGKEVETPLSELVATSLGSNASKLSFESSLVAICRVLLTKLLQKNSPLGEFFFCIV
ncbi:MAG: hypothetical protein AAB734_03725 [Patescibacteria group bacterium]